MLAVRGDDSGYVKPLRDGKTANRYAIDLVQQIVGMNKGRYLEKGLLNRNPFETVDPDGVGELVRIGAKGGRATKPDLKLGVCGEHGGDPESIQVFYDAGLDYVSCSPFRIPIARLAAAQAVLHG